MATEDGVVLASSLPLDDDFTAKVAKTFVSFLMLHRFTFHVTLKIRSKEYMAVPVILCNSQNIIVISRVDPSAEDADYHELFTHFIGYAFSNFLLSHLCRLTSKLRRSASDALDEATFETALSASAGNMLLEPDPQIEHVVACFEEYILSKESASNNVFHRAFRDMQNSVEQGKAGLLEFSIQKRRHTFDPLRGCLSHTTILYQCCRESVNTAPGKSVQRPSHGRDVSGLQASWRVHLEAYLRSRSDAESGLYAELSSQSMAASQTKSAEVVDAEVEKCSQHVFGGTKVLKLSVGDAAGDADALLASTALVVSRIPLYLNDHGTHSEDHHEGTGILIRDDLVVAACVRTSEMPCCAESVERPASAGSNGTPSQQVCGNFGIVEELNAAEVLPAPLERVWKHVLRTLSKLYVAPVVHHELYINQPSLGQAEADAEAGTVTEPDARAHESIERSRQEIVEYLFSSTAVDGEDSKSASAGMCAEAKAASPNASEAKAVVRQAATAVSIRSPMMSPVRSAVMQSPRNGTVTLGLTASAGESKDIVRQSRSVISGAASPAKEPVPSKKEVGVSRAEHKDIVRMASPVRRGGPSVSSLTDLTLPSEAGPTNDAIPTAFNGEENTTNALSVGPMIACAQKKGENGRPLSPRETKDIVSSALPRSAMLSPKMAVSRQGGAGTDPASSGAKELASADAAGPADSPLGHEEAAATAAAEEGEGDRDANQTITVAVSAATSARAADSAATSAGERPARTHTQRPERRSVVFAGDEREGSAASRETYRIEDDLGQDPGAEEVASPALVGAEGAAKSALPKADRRAGPSSLLLPGSRGGVGVSAGTDDDIVLVAEHTHTASSFPGAGDGHVSDSLTESKQGLGARPQPPDMPKSSSAHGRAARRPLSASAGSKASPS